MEDDEYLGDDSWGGSGAGGRDAENPEQPELWEMYFPDSECTPGDARSDDCSCVVLLLFFNRHLSFD